MRCLLTVVLLAMGSLPLAADPTVQLSARVTWNHPADWFGGFSGAEIAPDGRAITLITDKGSLVTARLSRANGTLRGVAFDSRTRLKAARGQILRGKRTDAEGLAIDRSGTAYVSFEHIARVARLNLADGTTQVLPKHPDFAGFALNQGMEALAVHPNGVLYTLPEASRSKRAAFPLYAFDGTGWRVTHKIPRRGPFQAVGADFDSKGRLYLLERAITPLGFRSRIRRFDLTPGQLREDSLLTTTPSRFDNLEALSIWQDASGQDRLIVISDDNFLSLQRTEIVEFTLHE